MSDDFIDEPQPKNIRDRAIPGRQSGRKIEAPPPHASVEDDDAQPADIVNVASSSTRTPRRRRTSGPVGDPNARTPRPGNGPLTAPQPIPPAMEAPAPAAPRPPRAGRPPQAGRPAVAAPPAAVPAAAVKEPESVKPARELLEGILERLGVAQAEVRYIPRSEGEYLEVTGPDLGNLIGRHGHTLEAMNLIFNNIINVGVRNNRKYYTIDAEGYRARRADQLKGRALQALERVVREGKPLALEPMLPSERKIVHLALADNRYVSTESEGAEPERRVVVKPK